MPKRQPVRPVSDERIFGVNLDQGIADFQKIVAQGISPQLLEWKGIEATEKLATSANAKVVIIGNPKNGLPLVLEPK